MRTWRTVLLILLLSHASLATTARPREVTCPVCEKEITVLVVMSSNSFGGQDFDLCTHAAGEDPRILAIWTCPHCLYSRYARTFEDPVPEGLAKRVREELKSPAPALTFTSQRSIPGWVKYTLAGTILEWQGAKQIVLADHYLAAAWTVRGESWTDFDALRQDPELDERLDEINDGIAGSGAPIETDSSEELSPRRRSFLLQGARLLRLGMSDELTPVDRALYRILAVQNFRARGESAPMIPVLIGVLENVELPPPIRVAAVDVLREVRREQSFQRMMLSWFIKAHDAGKIDPNHLPAWCYIAGDTLRMLGRGDEAGPWYLRAIEHDRCSMPIAKFALAGLARVGAPAPRDEKLAEYRMKRIVRLGEMLADPETTTAARDQMEFMKLAALTPAIIRALGSENKYVRANAAMALRHQPEPDDDAIRALLPVLADKEQHPRWVAANTMRQFAPSLARDRLEEVALAEDDERMREAFIHTLGIVGDTQTLPVLLKLYYQDTEEVELAISRLLNCPDVGHFESRTELEDWIEQNRPGEQRDWVRLGFSEAGIEIGDPWKRESIPKLLELLEHRKHWIRANAVRILREVSGRRLAWYEIARNADYDWAEKERASDIARWRAWWAEEQGK